MNQSLNEFGSRAEAFTKMRSFFIHNRAHPAQLACKKRPHCMMSPAVHRDRVAKCKGIGKMSNLAMCNKVTLSGWQHLALVTASLM